MILFSFTAPCAYCRKHYAAENRQWHMVRVISSPSHDYAQCSVCRKTIKTGKVETK